MKSGQYVLIAAIAALTITSCKKSSTPVPAKQVDVYIAGSVVAQGPLNASNVASYWKNGIITKLSDSTTNASGYAIIVNNGDIYVAGTRILNTTGNSMAVYWKNGKEVDLTNGATWASASSIAVDNGNVYVAGSIGNSQGISVAVYWKNGVMTQLSDGTAAAAVSAILINNGDVYMAGTDGNDGKIWKNGVATLVSRAPTSTASLSAITILGTDVYVAGYESGGGATYWKNGFAYNLTNTYLSYASGIAVNEDGIYVSGNVDDVNQNEPNVWIDNNSQQLQSGYSSANFAAGMAVSGQDVYLAGQFGSYAGYWRNGVAIVLANNGSANAIALVVH